MKYFFLTLILITLPYGVHAAELTLTPQDSIVGVGTPFLVTLDMSTFVPVNTIDISLSLPPGITVTDLSDGNSVVSYWIARPVFDEGTHTLSFSGITPGGFSGNRGRILTLTLTAKTQGTYTISVLPESKLYRNNPPATEEPFAKVSTTFDATVTKNSLQNVFPDSYPPEPFTPTVATFVTEGGPTAFLIFGTQDKGSGVDHYEVTEEHPLFPWIGSSKVAESPYSLKDQSRESVIIVRAFDKKGNIREEAVPPLHGSMTTLVIILVCLALILVVSLFSVRSRNV